MLTLGAIGVEKGRSDPEEEEEVVEEELVGVAKA